MVPFFSLSKNQEIKFPISNGFNSKDSFRYKAIVPLTSPMLPSHVELSNDEFDFQIEYDLVYQLSFTIGKSWKTHPENFPKFQFFLVIIQTILLENSSNFFKIAILGSWARPFYWKTNPKQIILSKVTFSGRGTSLDEFSSNTVWVITWKFLDDFSRTCP